MISEYNKDWIGNNSGKRDCSFRFLGVYKLMKSSMMTVHQS